MQKILLVANVSDKNPALENVTLWVSEWVWCVQVCVSACVSVCVCVCVWVCVRVWVHTWEREMHRHGEIFGFILFWHIALGSYFSEKRASVKTFLFLFCSVTRMREKEEEPRVIVCLSLCLSCFKQFPCFVLFCLAELLQNSPPFPCGETLFGHTDDSFSLVKNFSRWQLAYF